jgi:integrase
MRVQDINLERSLVYVRAPKGGKDRTTVLAKVLQGELRLHIERVKRLHEEDLSKGLEKFSCRGRLRGNIRVPARSSAGGMCFRRKA